ncbi:MAG: cell division protein ZapE [Gammaproteobacteria bacterium]|nr:cell division protein ZapE [Gammaproteobacteria bacterium]MDP6694017.1 cell division protein ZapE [Gammaproteobacteria bacterium]MDP7041812.1 cell division protein ZapE [Gammaproteobacteria bacterium]
MSAQGSTLRTYYERALAEHGFESDPAQLEAIAALEHTYAGLIGEHPGSGLFGHIKRRLRPDSGAVRGAYLWGDVGRGKTFIMDVFFDALPFDDKLRYHFHRLMYRVHRRLKNLDGQADPVDIVAGELAEQSRVICFDEFFVAEIGDAMILGKLLDGLFKRGVSLVATSNIQPDELYKDGLQRQRFLPAIELLNEHTRVTRVDGGNDYRLRVLEQAELWHSPLDSVAEENLGNFFRAIAPDAGTSGKSIDILGRKIPTRRRADGVAWFDFAALCDGPRSQDDYIELARAFQTVLVSGIPVLSIELENQARRFVALVDEFYDRRVKLVCSAEQDIAGIYRGRRLTQEFERTQSRLLEMQSNAYLSAPHVP